MKRWPQWRLTDDIRVMYQQDSGIAAAARANEAHRRQAESMGATLVPNARVTEVREVDGLYEMVTEAGIYRAEYSSSPPTHGRTSFSLNFGVRSTSS
jgi:glycine/D-amino acid oxidase-like deaminating enzyme